MGADESYVPEFLDERLQLTRFGQIKIHHDDVGKVMLYVCPYLFGISSDNDVLEMSVKVSG